MNFVGAVQAVGARRIGNGAFSRQLRTYLRRFRARVRDDRFWRVQVLVVVITGLHTAVESTHLLGDHEAIAFIPVSFYFIPVLYAGLNFGLEGALPTAFLSALLAVPNAFAFHGGIEGIGELFQLSVLGLVACLVALRVDREAQAKAQAEQIGERLAQLNATATAVSRSLAPDEVVRDTLDVILKRGHVDTAWIAAGPAAQVLRATTVLSSGPPETGSFSAACDELTRRVTTDGRARLERVEPHEGAVSEPGKAAMIAAVPIEAAGGRVGVLGVMSQRRRLSADDLSLLAGVAHQLAVALENIRHYQDEKRALSELRQAQEDLVGYLRLATEAQEEERKRLARELHDDTIQSLVVIKTKLDALTTHPRTSNLTRERLDAVKLMVEAAVDNVRRFSRDLRPSILDDLGLVHAIDWLVADLVRRTAIHAHLDVEGEAERLSADVEVAVYRIVQEALRNVEKHARAGSTVVTLTFGSAGLTMRVVDDGQGFDPAGCRGGRNGGTGLGLLGMQERARLIGGRLQIDSQPERGTSVCLELTAGR